MRDSNFWNVLFGTILIGSMVRPTVLQSSHSNFPSFGFICMDFSRLAKFQIYASKGLLQELRLVLNCFSSQ